MTEQEDAVLVLQRDTERLIGDLLSIAHQYISEVRGRLVNILLKRKERYSIDDVKRPYEDLCEGVMSS